MAFLVTEDYHTFITPEQLADVLEETDATLAAAEVFAQGQMESYLRARYDTVNIFNKVGAERNPDIVEKMVHLVLYKIHKPLSPGQMPEHIQGDYTDTIAWLKAVSKLLINPDLPVPETGEKAQILFGSQTKRNNYF